LRRAGFAVAVLERAPAFTQTGAGLTLTAPAMQALAGLGLKSAALAMSDAVPSTPIFHYQTGRIFHTRGPPIVETDTDGEQKYAPRVVHRADMHGLLLDTALAAGVELIAGARLVDVEQDEHGVRAICDDGRVETGRILIGADGLRSRVRALLHGVQQPNATAVVAWRCLLPVETVEDLLGGHRIAIHFGPTAHFVHYLVRHGTVLNCVALIKSDVRSEDGWSTPSTKAELAAELEGWHATLLALVDRIPAGTLYKWPLLDRDPIEHWVAGRIALLGDAAHPMLPYHGFGAAIAMEDAVVLGRALAEATDPREGLARYEKARAPRGRQAILSSRRLGERYMGGRGLELCTLPLEDPDLFRYDARTSTIS